MITMCEKFGTSGRGTGVGSSVGVSVSAMIVGLDVGRAGSVAGKDEGVAIAWAGWQAEVRKETRVVIHKRRMINFILASFLEFGSSASGTQK